MNKLILIFCVTLFFMNCKEKNKFQAETTQDEFYTKSESNNPKKDSIDNQTDESSQAIKHYICYAMNEKPKVIIWIAFGKDNRAIKVKYKGQKDFLRLTYVKEDYIKGGAQPTIKEHYHELLNGNINGTYILTHSGIWDYVEYTGIESEKSFNFTILHEENPYGKSPCF